MSNGLFFDRIEITRIQGGIIMEATIQKWRNYDQLDPTLKEELAQMNEKELEDAFYKELSFGTGGLRGLMGVGTNRVNKYTIRKVTLGLARYLKNKGLTGGVAISYDNRKDSRLFAFEAAQVLAAEAIDSFVFEVMRPTPCLSFAVRHYQTSAGIMITASHNPKEYNGYKVYDATGAQLNLDASEEVIQEVEKVTDIFHIPTVHDHHIHTIDATFDALYLDAIKPVKINDDEKIIQVIYSPLHGTGGTIIPQFLQSEGYTVHPVASQMVEDPNFTATKSSNPEEPLAYEEALKLARKTDADIILITDPDADRLGVVCLHDGDYHFLNGNQTAALELYYILSERKRHGTLLSHGHIYTTNVTTRLIDVMADDFEIGVVTTLTGFKFIGEKAEYFQNRRPYLFGCEESYGSLILDVVRDKDAVQAVYLLAEITNHLKHKQMTLIDYLETIYQRYGYYYEVTQSLTLTGVEGVKRIDAIMNHFRANPLRVSGRALIGYDDLLKGIQVADGIQSKSEFPEANVLKYYYDDQTWIALRPSGTEPKLKIYYGTRKTSLDEAKADLDRLDKEINQQIETI